MATPSKDSKSPEKEASSSPSPLTNAVQLVEPTTKGNPLKWVVGTAITFVLICAFYLSSVGLKSTIEDSSKAARYLDDTDQKNDAVVPATESKATPITGVPDRPGCTCENFLVVGRHRVATTDLITDGSGKFKVYSNGGAFTIETDDGRTQPLNNAEGYPTLDKKDLRNGFTVYGNGPISLCRCVN